MLQPPNSGEVLQGNTGQPSGMQVRAGDPLQVGRAVGVRMPLWPEAFSVQNALRGAVQREVRFFRWMSTCYHQVDAAGLQREGVLVLRLVQLHPRGEPVFPTCTGNCQKPRSCNVPLTPSAGKA